MKKILSFALSAIVILSANAQALKPKTINITFGGRGESTIVDEVTVENLSRPSSSTATVTLGGSDILHLSNVTEETGITENVQTELTRPMVYPSPAYGDGTLVFDAPKQGEISVRLVSMNGMVLSSGKFYVTKGRHTVTLPAQVTGFYAVSIEGAGIKSSTKWMCIGTTRNNKGMALDIVSNNSKLPLMEIQTRAAANEATMYYEVGDVLRFTGTSGKMRTIVMNSPTCNHDIMFDFYKCEDSNGYNYTVVRAGDMLWMTEDLHPQNGQSWLLCLGEGTKSLWNSVDPSTPMQIEIDGVAYFNKPAAVKALPEGWSLPTAGEIEYLANALGGKDVAGDKIKDHSIDWRSPINGIDSISFGAKALGYIDPGEGGAVLTNKGYTGAWLLANTIEKGGLATFEIRADGSELLNSVGGKGKRNFAFPLRGIRHVPSPYHQMMMDIDCNGDETANDVQNGPLGQFYNLSTGRTSIWYNFTGDQYKVAKMESRSGELYKLANSGKWSIANKEVMPMRELNQNGDNVLRKMAAQDNQRGYQNVIYAEWSRPFHLLVDPTKKDGMVWGDGSVKLWVYGDETNNFATVETTLKDRSGKDYIFTLPDLSNIEKRGGYFQDDPLSDIRYDYALRCFNIKCINDMTGDGIDEIVVNVGEKVAIFDGAQFTLIDDMQYNQEKTTILGHSSVRIEVADVDNDGLEDLLVLVANRNNSCSLKIYSHGDFKKNIISDISIPRYGILNDVKVGNCCGLPFKEIAVLTRAMKDKQNLEKCGYLFMYRLKKDDKGNYGFETVINNAEIDGFGEPDEHCHVGNCQLTFGYFRGRQYNQDLIVADGLWRAENGETAPKFSGYCPLDFTKNNRVCNIYADCIITNDHNGVGNDWLMFFRSCNYFENGNPTIFTHLCELKIKGDKDRDIWTNFNSSYMKYCDQGAKHDIDVNNWEFKKGTFNAEAEMVYWNNLVSGERCSNPTLVAVRSRELARTYKLESYDRAFSEPRIYALLAAAPYFEGYNEPGETTWGTSNNTENGVMTSDEFSSSLILGFEHEVTAPLLSIKLAEIEVSTTITTEASVSHGQSVSKEFGESHTAVEEDRVILQLSPYEQFTYRCLNSPNIDEIGGLLTVSMPMQRIFTGITLDDYNRLVADQPGVPQLTKLFTHTPGDPFTYPNDESYFKTNVKNGKLLWAHGNNNSETLAEVGSGGKTTRTISLSSAETDVASNTYGFETEIVTTVADIKVGAGFGYNHTNENSHTVSNTHEVSATVSGRKTTSDSDKNFSWNLCWFDYELNKQKFPVLHYIVKKRK